ncbi:MAG: THUMP domain-containing protein, partial [Verrucomicrobiota bacterium]
MNMLRYQKTGTFFVQVAAGLEEPGVEELERLGARNARPGFRSIRFEGDAACLYRVVYATRLASRILAPIIRFDCHSTNYLRHTALLIDWTELLDLNQTFAIFANVSNSRIRHARYASLCLKDAIVDQFRDRLGERPNVDPANPDCTINLYIHENNATISLDVSGRSLHKRGYRTASVSAPMQETLAAAIVQLSGWDGEQPLHDPMCGSGTILCEALMRYCRMPSGYLNPVFGLRFLPDYDEAIWTRVKEEADRDIRDLPSGLISGSDIDPEALEGATFSTRRASSVDVDPHAG